MLPILEFERRALEGPVMKADEFDLALAKKVRELVKEYAIKFNPEEIVVDDATADAVFKAGVDLLADIGVYHTETHRVIKWSKTEIMEMVEEYRSKPPAITFGRGKDAHTVAPRSPEDGRRPVLWTTVGGAIPEEYLIPWIQLCAQEELVQGFGIAGGVASVSGVTAKAGSPSEIFCGLWEVRAQREALRRAGRPDMHLGLIPTVSTVGGTAALLGPGLREPHNSMIGIHIIPEQKIDWSRLNLAYLAESRGISPWTSAMSVLGGLCGGPAGTAVGVTANFLGQLSYGHGKLGSIYVSDMAGVNSTRGAVWAYSASARAVGRNIGIATGTAAGSGSAAGSMDEALLRTFPVAIALTASGAAYSWCAGSTAVEARIHDEVMRGIAPMKREKVNEILHAVFSMIEQAEKEDAPKLSHAELHLPFPNKYDMNTLKPKTAFLDACKRVVERLVSAGVPISGRLVLE